MVREDGVVKVVAFGISKMEPETLVEGRTSCPSFGPGVQSASQSYGIPQLPETTLAVLPLRNLSGNPERDLAVDILSDSEETLRQRDFKQ